MKSSGCHSSRWWLEEMAKEAWNELAEERWAFPSGAGGHGTAGAKRPVPIRLSSRDPFPRLLVVLLLMF